LSDVDHYIKSRLDDQIQWYEQKASTSKLRYGELQKIIIIASGIIPLVSLGASALGDWWKLIGLLISAILGCIITIATAFTEMEKYFESWILYRTTAESLRREKLLFLNDAGEYSDLSGSVKNKALVERVELMLSSETSKFFAVQQQKRQQEQQTAGDK
jgi:hypothetical protein